MLTNLGPHLDHLVDLDRLKPQSIVVDAGACEGRFVDAMRATRFKGKIHMLEPNPSNVAALKMRRLYRTVLHRLALVGQDWPEDALAKFHEFIGLPEWGNITGLHLSTRHPKLQKIVDHIVPVVRINALFNFLGVDCIDYLKMDIEGSEGAVIETMTDETMCRIGQISFEIHDGVDRAKVIDKLKQHFTIIEEQKEEIYAGR